ncbi:helix-turn-helix domain-containing protein [Pelagicoccus albus]|uniref:AraC family transcriptional regulator n=1 Tax=Pelagicoccus albus TaxID=415222 RepID=A0A7X1E795_9BACT|nr:AraC family transcriptional regulator [Pelagicoccus albus]MBC2605104.1 AraC family transcriptional regulator [Pelagicoccus albus]
MPEFHATYLPASETKSPWQVDTLGAGYSKTEPGESYPPSNHPEDHLFEWERGRVLDEYQILFVSRGSGILETEETGPVSLEAPFVFLLFPGVWHRYRPDPVRGWEEHWIAFDGSYIRSLHEQGIVNRQQPIFEVGHADMILTQFQIVHDEAKAESLGFRRIVASAIIQILALSTSLPSRQKEEQQAVRASIRKACFLIRERTNEAISAEELAAELNVGYTYFRRMFKRYTGLSPKLYHTQLRLERAKRLLRESDQTVGEIASHLNFDSPFHFSNWFKKRTGAAPKNWRESVSPT